MATEKRISWKEASEKTCYAYNVEDEYLGCLKYERVGAHMHWCWFQGVDIRMSPGCLQEVRDKQKELFNEKRVKHRMG